MLIDDLKQRHYELQMDLSELWNDLQLETDPERKEIIANQYNEAAQRVSGFTACFIVIANNLDWKAIELLDAWKLEAEASFQEHLFCVKNNC